MLEVSLSHLSGAVRSNIVQETKALFISKAPKVFFSRIFKQTPSFFNKIALTNQIPEFILKYHQKEPYPAIPKVVETF